jgi:hypothetical protein
LPFGYLNTQWWPLYSAEIIENITITLDLHELKVYLFESCVYKYNKNTTVRGEKINQIHFTIVTQRFQHIKSKLFTKQHIRNS